MASASSRRSLQPGRAANTAPDAARRAARFAALLLVVLLGVPSAATADEILRFEVTSETRPPSGTSVKPTTAAKPSSERFPLTVRLAHHYLIVQHHAHDHIYDFEQRRIYDAIPAERTFSEYSLFSDVGFRVEELQNRLMIGKALAAGGVKLMPPALSEHLLAVTAGGENTVIDQAHERDEQVFRWQGNELLALSDAASPLPPEYQADYWRFLRYYVNGHPAIYTKLADRVGVPERLRVVLSNMSTETRTLRLVGIDTIAEAPSPLAELRPVPAPTAEPYATIAALPPDAAAGVDVRVTQARAARDDALAHAHYLDALLAHIETVLETGDQGSDWISAHREQLSADPESRRAQQALQPANATEASAAVATLDELRAASPDARFLLNVFAANDSSRANKAGDAIERLVAALHRNPYLIGAWFDLGAAYYSAFRPREAWACWDVARTLRPEHPFRRGPDGLEQRLVQDHPEFF